eukprot:g10176.t1
MFVTNWSQRPSLKNGVHHYCIIDYSTYSSLVEQTYIHSTENPEEPKNSMPRVALASKESGFRIMSIEEIQTHLISATERLAVARTEAQTKQTKPSVPAVGEATTCGVASTLQREQISPQASPRLPSFKKTMQKLYPDMKPSKPVAASKPERASEKKRIASVKQDRPTEVQRKQSGKSSLDAEKLLERRRINRRVEYLVKWEGYPLEQATWEPEKILLEDGMSKAIQGFLEEQFKLGKLTSSKEHNKRIRAPKPASRRNRSGEEVANDKTALRAKRSLETADCKENIYQPNKKSKIVEAYKFWVYVHEEDTSEEETKKSDISDMVSCTRSGLPLATAVRETQQAQPQEIQQKVQPTETQQESQPTEFQKETQRRPRGRPRKDCLRQKNEPSSAKRSGNEVSVGKRDIPKVVEEHKYWVYVDEPSGKESEKGENEPDWLEQVCCTRSEIKPPLLSSSFLLFHLFPPTTSPSSYPTRPRGPVLKYSAPSSFMAQIRSVRRLTAADHNREWGKLRESDSEKGGSKSPVVSKMCRYWISMYPRSVLCFHAVFAEGIPIAKSSNLNMLSRYNTVSACYPFLLQFSFVLFLLRHSNCKIIKP